MIEKIFKGRLLATHTDICDYTTYVFENLEPHGYEDTYIMCTRFPNWNSKILHINDSGFILVRYIEQGKDEWFDGETSHKYKFSGVHFIKFIDEKKNYTDAFKI